MPYTDDPIADFMAHDAEEERWRKKRPRCSDCREHIVDDKAYYIGGEWICKDCIDSYLEDVEDE